MLHSPKAEERVDKMLVPRECSRKREQMPVFVLEELGHLEPKEGRGTQFPQNKSENG